MVAQRRRVPRFRASLHSGGQSPRGNQPGSLQIHSPVHSQPAWERDRSSSVQDAVELIGMHSSLHLRAEQVCMHSCRAVIYVLMRLAMQQPA